MTTEIVSIESVSATRPSFLKPGPPLWVWVTGAVLFVMLIATAMSFSAPGQPRTSDSIFSE